MYVTRRPPRAENARRVDLPSSCEPSTNIIAMAAEQRNHMEWSEQHDQLLCREVLVSEPFRFPKRSKERGEIWAHIANSLNGISLPRFRVTKRSVRDRLTLLLTKYKQKIRTEERASGIDCEETEVEAALADILEKEKLADEEREKDATVTAKKNANDKAAAEEVRMQAMERLGTTKRRHAADNAEGRELPPKKGRRQSSDAYLYLREKHERDAVLMNEKMDWKKKDYEQRMVQQHVTENQNKQLQKQQQDMLTVMQQQQQNFQALFLQQHQQQQQQNQLLVSLLEKIKHS